MARWAMMLPSVARRSPAMITPSAKRRATTVVAWAPSGAGAAPSRAASAVGPGRHGAGLAQQSDEVGPGSLSGGKRGSATGDYCPPFWT